MIRTDDLRGIIAKKGYTQADIARMIGITPKTFYEKMKSGVFGSDEIQIMIEKLQIDNPIEIFFCKWVNLKVIFKSGYSIKIISSINKILEMEEREEVISGGEFLRYSTEHTEFLYYYKNISCPLF